jgi:hypothetical protein
VSPPFYNTTEYMLSISSMWAQALLLTSVLSLPLSYGAHLEYYFTTLLPNTPLILLVLPLALQILLTSLAPFPIGFLYQKLGRRAYWKLTFAFAAVVAVTSQILLHWITSYIGILLLQGVLLGCALGTLFTISSLVLSTYYRGDVPLVSVQSGFAGFAGAVIHTLLARFSFQAQRGDGYEEFAHAASGGVMGASLLLAFFLLTRLKAGEWSSEYHLKLSGTRNFLKDLGEVRGMLWFLLAYMLVSFGVLIYPVYGILLLAQDSFPDQACFSLLAMLGVAALSASVAANARVRERVGPVNTFGAAAVLAGAVTLAPVLYPKAYIGILLGGVYGIALGAVMSLHMIVAAIFVSEKEEGRWADDIPARVAVVMALGGVSTCVGLLVAAMPAGSMASVMLKIAGACMIGGGLLIGLIRVMRWREKGVFYVV